jgi:hypothetical protein
MPEKDDSSHEEEGRVEKEGMRRGKERETKGGRKERGERQGGEEGERRREILGAKSNFCVIFLLPSKPAACNFLYPLL